MDVHAGPRIYRLVADNHARECVFEDNHYMHMYGGDACMHVLIPFHNIDVARASKIVYSPQTDYEIGS